MLVQLTIGGPDRLRPLEEILKENPNLTTEEINDLRNCRDRHNILYPIPDLPAGYYYDNNLEYINTVEELNSYPERSYKDLEWFKLSPRSLPSYGICDTRAQFMRIWDRWLSEHPDKFVVGLRKSRRKDRDQAGWRWHKQGPYIGNFKPQYEHFMDEPFIKEVWFYSIYKVIGIRT